jgi:hypothetical protein
MLTRDGKGLEIFENFWVDRRLPKHRPPPLQDQGQAFPMQVGWQGQQAGVTISGNTFTTGALTSSPLIVKGWTGQTMNLAQSTGSKDLEIVEKKSLLSKLKALFKRTPKQIPLISIEDFFKSVKNSVEELKVVEERTAGYKAAMENALNSGQTALYEQLGNALLAVRAETQLFAMDSKKYLEEAVLVDFVKKATKGLRLDWIRNFARVIPQTVLDTKKKADDNLVFDNYVVLHYDPEAKSYAETEAEKNRRKDPILFGVLQDRRRLYFIGDWVDEFCDLTLDQIADALGKEAVGELK